MQSFASFSPNQRAASTSGKVCNRPLRGGHSSEKVFPAIVAGSKSYSSANASTSLPPFCLTLPSGASGPAQCDAQLFLGFTASGLFWTLSGLDQSLR